MMRAHLTMLGVLSRRGINEILRVPGASIPGVLAPCIFVLATTAVFGKLAVLPGFTTDHYLTFAVAVGLLQGAGFSGAATGVNLARDIEQGWFDRLLLSPAPRWVLLLGTMLSACLRSLIPASALLIVTLALGASFPGLDGLLLVILLVPAFAAVASLWGITLALRFRTQSAAPLMQAGMFMALLFTTAYAPQKLLTGWLSHVAKYNPVTRVVEGVRQGFVASVTWGKTWPALLAIAGLVLVLAAASARELRRVGA
jgi:ABC-type polysaccharide/polyol phosphate export permease